MARILEGRDVVARLRGELRARVDRLVAAGAARPRIALVRFQSSGPEAVYSSTVARSAIESGVEPLEIAPEGPAEMRALTEIVAGLNDDPSVAGIVLVQPLPAELDRERAVALVAPDKDVDGAHPVNAGRLVRGSSTFVPATALAVMAILRHFEIPLAGQHAVVVGRSAVVGRPVAGLLLEADATVTVCHRQTQDLAAETRRADVLVAAAGSPGLVTAEMVTDRTVVIDAGYNTTPDGVRGDVAFDGVSGVVAAITPVPGGVGRVAPMMVLEQTVLAAEQRAAWGI